MATLGHADMPYPKGTLVEDTASERTGHLMGVVEQRSAGGRLIGYQAFVRPVGGGIEWEAPVARIKPVGGQS